MIIVMKAGATRQQTDHVFEKVRELGYQVHPIFGEQRTVIACVGDERGIGNKRRSARVEWRQSIVAGARPHLWHQRCVSGRHHRNGRHCRRDPSAGQ